MFLMALGASKAHFHYSLNLTASHTKHHQGVHGICITEAFQRRTKVATRTRHHNTPRSRPDGRVVQQLCGGTQSKW